MPAQVNSIIEWFNATIAGSVIWSSIGFAAALLAVLFAAYLLLKGFAGLITLVTTTLASRKRRSSQGFGIAIAPIIGPKGMSQTKQIIAALDEHLDQFTFGSPSEIVRAPRMRAKGAKGLRAAATKWLEKSSTDLVIWGHRQRGKSEPARVEVLSLGGSLKPNDAMHSEGLLPYIDDENVDVTGRVVAYLVARALQPGLADGSAYRPEKLEPVATILMACLQHPEALPEQTQLTLESDFCSMALAIGTRDYLTRVVEFRRKRLAGDAQLPPTFEIGARIDLGRALLAQAQANFDPVRVREAMDHLKIAVERLKVDPILQLAQATNQAVLQGQEMLSNRKRFSVTGGSTL
eukprot:g2927.t1